MRAAKGLYHVRHTEPGPAADIAVELPDRQFAKVRRRTHRPRPAWSACGTLPPDRAAGHADRVLHAGRAVGRRRSCEMSEPDHCRCAPRLRSSRGPSRSAARRRNAGTSACSGRRSRTATTQRGRFAAGRGPVGRATAGHRPGPWPWGSADAARGSTTLPRDGQVIERPLPGFGLFDVGPGAGRVHPAHPSRPDRHALSTQISVEWTFTSSTLEEQVVCRGWRCGSRLTWTTTTRRRRGSGSRSRSTCSATDARAARCRRRSSRCPTTTVRRGSRRR